MRVPASFLPFSPIADSPGAGWERAGRRLMLLVLVGIAPWALYRMIHNGGSDFFEFHAAGRYLLDHGVRHPQSVFTYYWPSLDAAWTALGRMPIRLAAGLWYLAICGAWLGLLSSIGHHLLADVAEPARRRAVLTAGLLMLPVVVNHLCLGAFHILMVWWMVAGLGRIRRGQPVAGGLLLGLAIWIKLLPLLAVGYLLIKRRLLAAAVAVSCALVVHGLLSTATMGPAEAWSSTLRWWRLGAAGTAESLLNSPQAIYEQRENNQSPLAVLRRVLTRMGLRPGTPRAAIAVGDLSPGQLRAVYLGVQAALGLGLLVLWRRPATEVSESRGSMEIATVVLATMWFSPIVWSYHPTAAVPALALALGWTWSNKPLARGIVALAALAIASLGWRMAGAVGAALWATLALAAFLARRARSREGVRQPDRQEETARDSKTHQDGVPQGQSFLPTPAEADGQERGPAGRPRAHNRTGRADNRVCPS